MSLTVAGAYLEDLQTKRNAGDWDYALSIWFRPQSQDEAGVYHDIDGAALARLRERGFPYPFTRVLAAEGGADGSAPPFGPLKQAVDAAIAEAYGDLAGWIGQNVWE